MATIARPVVDASVVLKWQLDDEEHTLQALALRDDYYVRGAVTLIAPQLLVYEVVNGIATATRQKRVPLDKAAAAISNLLALAVGLKEVEPLRVLDLALQHSIAAYDAAYLALAEAETCELWTGDKSLYRAARDKLPWVKWIGDYVSTVADDGSQAVDLLKAVRIPLGATANRCVRGSVPVAAGDGASSR